MNTPEVRIVALAICRRCKTEVTELTMTENPTCLPCWKETHKKVGRTKAAKRALEISFHADQGDAHPAIKVKYYGFPNALDDSSEQLRTFAWDATVSQFWDNANHIASQHGYSGVFSEGRSGGWLVPYYQFNSAGKQTFEWVGQGPEHGYPRYPDVMEDLKERKRFARFQKDILALLADVPDMILENAKQYIP